MSFIVSADGSSTIFIRGVAVKSFYDLQTNNVTARYPTNPVEEAWVEWASIPLVAPSLTPGSSSGVVSKRSLQLARDAASTATDYLAFISADPGTIDVTRAIPAQFDPSGSYVPTLIDATGAAINFDGTSWYINSMYETAGSPLPNVLQGAVIFPGSVLPNTTSGVAPVLPLTLTYFRYEGTTGGAGGGGGGGVSSVTGGAGIGVVNTTTTPIVSLNGTTYNGNINYGLAGTGVVAINTGSTGSVQIGNDTTPTATFNGINTTIGSTVGMSANHTLNLLTGDVSAGLRTVNIGSGAVSTTAGLRAVIQIGPSASTGISVGTALIRMQNADITNGNSTVIINSGSLVGTSNSRTDVGCSTAAAIGTGSASTVNILTGSATGTGLATINVGGGSAATMGNIAINIGGGSNNQTNIGKTAAGTTAVVIGGGAGSAQIGIGSAPADTTTIGGGAGAGGVVITAATPVTNLITSLALAAGTGTVTGSYAPSATGSVTVIAGTGITLTGGAGTITIDSSGGGFNGIYDGSIALNCGFSGTPGTTDIGTAPTSGTITIGSGIESQKLSFGYGTIGIGTTQKLLIGPSTITLGAKSVTAVSSNLLISDFITSTYDVLTYLGPCKTFNGSNAVFVGCSSIGSTSKLVAIGGSAATTAGIASIGAGGSQSIKIGEMRINDGARNTAPVAVIEIGRTIQLTATSSATAVRIGPAVQFAGAATSTVNIGDCTNTVTTIGTTGSTLVIGADTVTNMLTNIVLSSGTFSATPSGVVNLIAGNGITLTPGPTNSGILTIAASGGGGGAWAYTGNVLSPDPAFRSPGILTNLVFSFTSDISTGAGTNRMQFYSQYGAFHIGNDVGNNWSSSTAQYAVSMGGSHRVEGNYATVVGGNTNTVSDGSDNSVIVGGNNNNIGKLLLVPGCVNNTIFGSANSGIAPYETLIANGSTGLSAAYSSVCASNTSFIGNDCRSCHIYGVAFQSVIAASRYGYNSNTSSTNSTNNVSPSSCVIIGSFLCAIVNGPNNCTILNSDNSVIGEDISGAAPPGTFQYCAVLSGTLNNIKYQGTGAQNITACTILNGNGNAINGGTTSALSNATICNGSNNRLTLASYSTIINGQNNILSAPSTGASTFTTIINGRNNSISDGNQCIISAGQQNQILSATINTIDFCAILNGSSCSISNVSDSSGYSTIISGVSNSITAGLSTIVGGSNNHANAIYSTIVGGFNNTVGGNYSVVIGGTNCSVSGRNCFIAGSYAGSSLDGCFAWSDNSSTTPFGPSAPLTFNVKASGGIFMYTDSAATVGVTIGAGGTSWSALSDRNAKENFTAVDFVDVLRRVDELPVTEWNYIGAAPGVRNIGPTAQDWQRLFPLGRTELRIDTQEFDGVTIAALKGLSELRRRDAAENAELRQQVSALTAQLAKLAATVAALAGSLQR